MKYKMLLVFVLSYLCTLCLCGESSAALDPELKTPYTLKVVLHFATHQLLTPVFRERVERDLRDGLQASFGALVNVEVTCPDPDRDQRLNQVLQNGLKSLDGWRERSAVKTHFVLIDYSGVHYEIQARQFDGLTGRPSPVVRRDRTRDRGFVAKTAALLIDQDFGLTGAFDAWPQEEKPGEDNLVVVNLKGGGLGASLDRWIKKDDVFEVVQMPFGDAAPGKLVEGALLQVETPPAGTDSTCRCRPFRRYTAPASAGAGFRCVKLGTVSAPLSLRLRQALTMDRSGPLSDPLSVQIRRHGFENEKTTVLQKQTDSLLDSVDTGGDKFSNVAFVTVLSSDNKVRARVPVPMLDDQPVVLAVNVSDDAGATLAFDKTAWERDVANAWQEQNELFREINEEASKAENRAEFMKKIETERLHLQKEVDGLAARQVKVKPGPGDQDVVDRLNKVRKGQDELTEFLAKLKKIDAEENDPHKREWRADIAKAQQLEAEWELEKAIKKYEAMLKGGAPNDALKASLEAHLVDLRKEWEPKSEAHRKARAFIYDVWPTLHDAELKDKLAEVRKAFDVCNGFHDIAALRKLFNATIKHASDLTDELKKLDLVNTIEDEKEAKIIQEASKGLRELARDVNTALATAAPAGK